jgi:hypothetical protein
LCHLSECGGQRPQLHVVQLLELAPALIHRVPLNPRGSDKAIVSHTAAQRYLTSRPWRRSSTCSSRALALSAMPVLRAPRRAELLPRYRAPVTVAGELSGSKRPTSDCMTPDRGLAPSELLGVTRPHVDYQPRSSPTALRYPLQPSAAGTRSHRHSNGSPRACASAREHHRLQQRACAQMGDSGTRARARLETCERSRARTTMRRPGVQRWRAFDGLDLARPRALVERDRDSP